MNSVTNNRRAASQNKRRENPSGVAYQNLELTVLNEIARTLNASVDLSTILDRALAKTVELLHLETGWILLFEEASGEP